MRVLALDSSGLVASVALLEDEAILGEYSTNFHKTHSTTLLPMLDELMRMLELDIKEASIDVIAVAKGPGSFTGLRIGAATAKGLALALKVPIIGVSTLAALAFGLWGSRGLVCPIMDARRDQVYTGLYRFGKPDAAGGISMETVKEPCAVSIRQILNDVNTMASEVVFTGDGVSVFKDNIISNTTVPYSFAPPSHNRQRASAVGAYAISMVGKDSSLLKASGSLELDYLRLSQAERERLAAGGSIE